MIIPKVSPKMLDAMRTTLTTKNGATVTGSTDGQITGHGITAKYHYDTAAQTLSIDILHHPFFESEATIEKGIRAAIAAEPAAAGSAG